MSLTTVSTKKNRIYQRRFDHDEAIALRAEGWSYRAIADLYGVSQAAVSRVCDPSVRARMDSQTNDWARRNRTACKGGCGRLVWGHSRSGYCRSCMWAKKAAERTDVAPEMLRCFRCDAWSRMQSSAPIDQSRRDEATRGTAETVIRRSGGSIANATQKSNGKQTVVATSTEGDPRCRPS